MSIADGFERKVLFRLTRILALVIVIALLAGAAAGVYAGWSMWPSGTAGNVSAADVVEKLRGDAGGNGAAQDDVAPTAWQTAQSSPLDGVRIPPSLLPEFAVPGEMPSDPGAIWSDAETRASNRKVLGNWTTHLDLPQRQKFVDEMAAAVDAAEQAGFERSSAMNGYATLKQERAASAAAEEAKAKEMRMWGAGVTGAALLLIALFSLVLVLLAIERNTRMPKAA